MFEKQIEAAVEKALDRRIVRPDKKLTLEGYHPLPEIMGRLYEWLFIPFRGMEILVEVRFPRSTQLPEVDKLYGIIEHGKDKKEKTKLTRQQMIDVMNIQEQCCRAVLNRPTFEELEQAIYGKDKVLETRKKQIEEMRQKLKSASGFERQELQKEIDNAEMFTGYILPDDTTVALTNIALGIGLSDIENMTRDKLLAAYSKARLYNQKPSDFISGIFTDGDRENIDNYATVLGSKEEIKRMEETKRRSK